MIVHKNDELSAIKSFNATICWLSETDLTPNRTYLIMHTSRTSKAKIVNIHNKININTIEKEDALSLKTNDIANISFKLAQPLIVDKYANHKSTGAFIIVDESTFHTVGAGMINTID
jgi:sulfate adenylyltransferase subunit 1